MSKLSSPNPYDVLGLSPDADKSTITRAFTQKNRGTSQERTQARTAYDTLRKIEERILVDAFIPIFDKGEKITKKTSEWMKDLDNPVDWSRFLDNEFDYNEIFQNFIQEIIKEFFNALPPPEIEPQLLTEFDDLEGSIQRWLTE